MLVIILVKSASGQSKFFLRPVKSVPRIGRSGNSKNSNIDEMGKFFLKASKSVPRIGRRNEESSYTYKFNIFEAVIILYLLISSS